MEQKHVQNHVQKLMQIFLLHQTVMRLQNIAKYWLSLQFDAKIFVAIF